jgi:methylthioxylose transferase
LVSASIAAALCGYVASQQLLLGDPSAGWIYPYVAGFDSRPLVAAALVIVVALTLLRVLPAPDERNEWLVIAIWILAAIPLQGVLRSLSPYSTTDIFSSDAANAFYRVTQMADARTVLSDFTRERANWPLHAQSNMPGKILLLFGLELLSNRPAVLAWLIVAVSSIGGVLLYLFVRDLFNDRQAALFTLILYLFLPSRLFFLPLMNTVTPVVLFACAFLVLRWLDTGTQWYAAAAGIAVYLLILFEPLPLVMGVLFLALIARVVVRGAFAPLRIGLDVLAGALAFTATYLAMRLSFDFDLFVALRKVTEHAVAFNETEGRPYGYWIGANLREFVFGAGMCQAVLFVVALIYSLRSARIDAGYLASPISLLTISLAVILATTDLIGVNRGEVVRLWIFLACFCQIPAAYVCARLDRRAAIIVVVSMTILHAAIATSMIGFVLP